MAFRGSKGLKIAKSDFLLAGNLRRHARPVRQAKLYLHFKFTVRWSRSGGFTRGYNEVRTVWTAIRLIEPIVPSKESQNHPIKVQTI
jgi:hypothetical protein